MQQQRLWNFAVRKPLIWFLSRLVNKEQAKAIAGMVEDLVKMEVERRIPTRGVYDEI